MNNISITITSKIDGSAVFNSEDKYDPKHIPAGIPVIDVIDDSLDSFVFTVKDVLNRKPFQPFDLVTLTIGEDSELVTLMIGEDSVTVEQAQYFVLNDHVKTYRQIAPLGDGKPRSRYEHTITCVETTKYLEKIKVFELTMTNRHDTLYDQFVKAMNNIEPKISHVVDNRDSFINSTRFRASGALWHLLEKVEGFDFSFQDTDARTIFDAMLERVNARVVVDKVEFNTKTRMYNITLGYHLLDVATDVEANWSFGSHGEIVHEEMQSDGQDYAGTIVARGYNSIPAEPLTVRVIPASSEATLSDKSATLFLPYPISRKGIKSIKQEVTICRCKNYTSPDTYCRETLDLTKYFILDEEYALMDEDTKKTRIAYSIGSKEIMLGQSYTNWWGRTELSLDVIQEQILTTIKTSENLSGVFAEEALWDSTFQVEYYPILDTVASIQKTDNPNLFSMAIMDAQTEQTLDISRHGKKLAGLLKRVGNDSYVVDVKAKTYSGLLKLLSRIDVDGEKYVLYKREYAVYDNFVNCRYYFSQNYTAVQENAGINRERQIYPIPLEYNETPILIKKKLEFMLAPEGTLIPDLSIPNPFSAEVVKSAIRTLTGENYIGTENDSRGKLNYLLFISKVRYKDSSGEQAFAIRPPLPTETRTETIIDNGTEKQIEKEVYIEDAKPKWYLLPLTSYVLDNTMNFIASPLDNYSVAYSRGGYEFSLWGDGGTRATYNPYVNAWDSEYVGEAERFYLSYAFDFSKFEGDGIDNSKGLLARIPVDYPIVERTSIISAMSASSPEEGLEPEPNEDYGNCVTVDYKKDRMQKPVFVLSFSVTVAEEDKGKLFVDPIFAKMNNLVRDNGNGLGMGFWYKKDPFREGDEYVDDETAAIEGVTKFFEIEQEGHYVKLKPKQAAIDLPDLIDPNIGIGSWGFCDDNGRIYLAVNGEICPIVLALRDYYI